MLASIEGMEAKLGEGMWSDDFHQIWSTNWLLTKLCSILYFANQLNNPSLSIEQQVLDSNAGKQRSQAATDV